MTTKMHRLSSLTRTLSGITLLLASGLASATPFTITAQLTGDSRVGNPDNLFVDVTINVDAAMTTASWIVDINSPNHPNIKLDEFLFNVQGSASDYIFQNFDPLGWEAASPGTPPGLGGGAATFLFEIIDPPGPPQPDDVTNSRNLTFDMVIQTGTFSEDTFLLASSTSGAAGSGQLGAHLQSLTTAGNCGSNCSDSGFALGVYTSGQPQPNVPEPGVLALFGLGLLGIGWARRKTA